MVRAVTFDMDDTLRQVQPFPPHLRFAELCAAADIHLTVEQALEGARARKRFYEDRRARREGQTEEWAREYAVVGLRAAGVSGDLDKLGAAVREARRRMPAPSALDPDVPAVLDRLRAKGFLLGVVSNWGSNLAEALRAYGIAHYFACIIDSTTVGVQKPDAGIYMAACTDMQVDPTDCAHVGDSPAQDVGVARAVGASAILYDPLDCLDAGCRQVHHLMDIVTLL